MYRYEKRFWLSRGGWCGKRRLNGCGFRRSFSPRIAACEAANTSRLPVWCGVRRERFSEALGMGQEMSLSIDFPSIRRESLQVWMNRAREGGLCGMLSLESFFLAATVGSGCRPFRLGKSTAVFVFTV